MTQRMTLMLALIASLAVGCVDARPAAPMIVVKDPGGDPALHAQYVDAFNGWQPLGFDFTFEDPHLVECPDWRVGDPTDCERVIYLFRVPGLVTNDGTGALYDPVGSAINIDSQLDGWNLDIAAAHEMGHAVLRTGTHTQGGIMGGADDRMWDVDRALACQAIGVCL